MTVSTYTATTLSGVLRNAIIEQRLAPGLQLKEQPLADAFGVPRAVVRQVLSTLAAHRLVEHKPNQGMFVASPDSDEAQDVLSARVLIEGEVVRKLAKQISPQQVEELRAMIAREESAYQSADMPRALRLSVDFHKAVARMAGNVVYEQCIGELVERTPLVILSHQPKGMNPCPLCNHTDIVDAMEAGDGLLARRLMTQHLEQIEEELNLKNARRPESKMDASAIFKAIQKNAA